MGVLDVLQPDGAQCTETLKSFKKSVVSSYITGAQVVGGQLPTQIWADYKAPPGSDGALPQGSAGVPHFYLPT